MAHRIELSPFAARLCREASPLFLTGAAPGCGVGFVADLLNASGRFAIYDSNPLLCETLPAVVAEHSARARGAQTSPPAGARALFLAAGGRGGGPGAPPDGALAAGALDAFYAFVARYEADSRLLGRGIWGMEHLFADMSAAIRLVNLVPNARVVFVGRGLDGTLAAARAAGEAPGPGPDGDDAVAETWTRNMEAAARLAEEDWFLNLSHEASVADPALALARVERFLGGRRLRRGAVAAEAAGRPRAVAADPRRLAGPSGG